MIAEQNQALSRQQQEVRELQQRLQQEHQEYENKYKQAMDEVHNVTRQAAQELETYKKALATREGEISEMRKAGQHLIQEKQSLRT